ncbi:MAG: hypothetical protein LUD69_08495 [Oscillospiraceae bacterium]|nr:hypothetical protein [Oscillospiraceae bacterium]MCD8376969.1 hypothetical protein [Oscillospiraceae bacterium]
MSESLHALLSDAFEGGERASRELRLSDALAGELSSERPEALHPLGERWYLVTLPSPI